MAGILHISTAKLSLLLALSSVVCLGQTLPFGAADYAAKVITATGQVSVLKDSQPWALDVGDKIQVKQLVMTGPDGHAVFQVNDGSTFEVYPNSQVIFRNNAPNWMDLLDVLLGRVRIHIEHLGSRPNPNRVLTPTAVISVRGTTFDVAVEEDTETTFVEVEDGVVQVQHALLPRGNPVILNPGETIRVYKYQPLASNWIDKGTIWRQAIRMIVDAVSTYAMRTARISGIGGGTTNGGWSSDTGKGGIPTPPKSAPPLPPAPPPIAPPL